jgi:hypothetical protein
MHISRKKRFVKTFHAFPLSVWQCIKYITQTPRGTRTLGSEPPLWKEFNVIFCDTVLLSALLFQIYIVIRDRIWLKFYTLKGAWREGIDAS